MDAEVGATVRLTLFHEQMTRQMNVVVAERPVRPPDSFEQETLAPAAGGLGMRGAARPRTIRLIF